jgi:hypothetical protein
MPSTPSPRPGWRWADDVSHIGYDRARLATLRVRAITAIESLRAVASDDPAAWDAVLAARVAREHLERNWLPMIDRIIASEAMVTWHRCDLRGAIAGADDARAMVVLLRLAGALGPAARQAFFTDLGGEGTARLFIELGVNDFGEDVEANRMFARVARDELSATTRGPGLPPGFAAELVAEFVEAPLEIGRDPTATFRFLLGDVHYGRDFLVATAEAALRYEIASAGERSFGDPYWPSGTGSTLAAGLADDADPIELLMEDLGGDAVAWRMLLAEPTVARYLLAERRFDPDGLTRLAAGAELAAAGPDVGPDSPAALLHDAAFVASAFVNHFATRGDLLNAPPEVSAAAARTLGRHLFAVHKDVLNPEPLDQPATLRRGLDAFGPDFAVEVPVFDEDALAAVTDLAVHTDEGLATLRTALNDYEQGFAAAAATASTRADVADPDQFLEQAIGQLGRLEGYLLQHAGHLAEREGHRRDEVVSRWIDGALGTVSLGVGKLGIPVPGPLVRPAEVKERWATHEDAAEKQFSDYAAEWTESLRYTWFRELHAAGVIAPDLPAVVLTADGRLRPWQELDGVQRRIVDDLMAENTWRGSVDVDWFLLSDAVKTAQQDLYADWDG